jgi:TolA-binding protein
MAVTKAVLSNLVVLALLMIPDAAIAQRSYTEDRINQLQQSVTELTRRLQELQKQNQQLQQQLEKMQSSYEQRLDRLEKGNVAKAPAVRTGQSKPKP